MIRAVTIEQFEVALVTALGTQPEGKEIYAQLTAGPSPAWGELVRTLYDKSDQGTDVRVMAIALTMLCAGFNCGINACFQ